MLSRYLTKGAKMMGLSELVNSGRPAFDGCYRVVPVGGSMVVEFFDAALRPDKDKMHKVRILPYRSGMINQAILSGQEVISGEFTGCVMSLFKLGGALTAGHVDTNPDTSQRAAYATMMADKKNELVAEYDTSGKLPNDASKLLICVATTGTVDHYLVDKSSVKASKNVPANRMTGMSAGWALREESVYTVQ